VISGIVTCDIEKIQEQASSIFYIG